MWLAVVHGIFCVPLRLHGQQVWPCPCPHPSPPRAAAEWWVPLRSPASRAECIRHCTRRRAQAKAQAASPRPSPCTAGAVPGPCLGAVSAGGAAWEPSHEVRRGAVRRGAVGRGTAASGLGCPFAVWWGGGGARRRLATRHVAAERAASGRLPPTAPANCTPCPCASAQRAAQAHIGTARSTGGRGQPQARASRTGPREASQAASAVHVRAQKVKDNAVH